MDKLEMNYKRMLYSVFELSEKMKYAAVLMELGLMCLCQIIAKLQLMYINKVVWKMQGTVTNAAIMEEFRLLGSNSTLALADCLSAQYDLPPVFTHYMGIKFEV